MLLVLVYVALAHWLALALVASTLVRHVYRYVTVKVVAAALSRFDSGGSGTVAVQHTHDVVTTLEPGVRGFV